MKNPWAILIGMSAAALLPSAAPAADAVDPAACGCEQYEGLVRLSSLGSDVSLIGLSAIQEQSRSPGMGKPSIEELQALRLRVLSNALIPWNCRSRLAEKIDPKWSVLLRQFATFDFQQNDWSGKGSDVDVQYYHLLAAGNTRCMETSKAMSAGTSPGPLPDYCTESENRARLKKYLKSDDKAILADLAKVDLSAAGIQSKSDLRLYRIYDQLLEKPTEGAVLGKLRAQAGKLTGGEKVRLVQMIGARFLMNYDDARAGDKDVPNRLGAVSFDAMMKAAAENTDLEFFGGVDDPSKAPAGTRFAGVCRDIAWAQGKMLESLGMKDTYIIENTRMGGGHATLVTRDPKQPRKIYKMDYGDVQEVTGDEGGKALYQGWDDVSTSYTVYKLDGSPAAITPSEFGKFMTEAAGFDIQTLDPMLRTTSSLASANFRVDAHGNTQARVFTGRDGVGAGYTGGAVTQSYSVGPLAPGKVGLVAAVRQNPVPVPGEPATSTFLQARYEQSLRTPRITPQNASSDVYLQARTLGAFEGEIKPYQGKNTLHSTFRIDDARHEAGVRVDHRAPGLEGTLYAGFQTGQAFKDIRVNEVDTNGDGKPEFEPTRGTFVNFTTVSAEVGIPLDDDQKSKAAAGTTIVCNAIGCRGRAQIAAVYRDLAASLSLQGRLTEQSNILEGSDRRLAVDVTAPVPHHPHAQINTRGSISLETGDVDASTSLKIGF